jgi:hypothetical protein
MADLSQRVNGFTDEKIQRSIRVITDYSPDKPELVFFEWKPDHPHPSTHKGWQCLDFITSWLKENNIHFSVSAFQADQCHIFVHSREARTMLKMMFEQSDKPMSTMGVYQDRWFGFK